MRPRHLTSILMAVLLAGALPGCGPDAQPAGENAAAIEAATVDFDVQGMTCASCEVSIKLALKKIDGVVDVSADAEAGTARATFDPSRTDGPTLAAAISKLGYAATVHAEEGS